MTDQSLDTKLVKDWEEVIPVVRLFYERFFGEPFPEDLKVEMVPFEDLEAYGKCNVLTGEMSLAIGMSLHETAKTFVHERTHYLLEKNLGLGTKHRETLASISNSTSQDYSFFMKCEKEYLRYIFLEECVASTVEAAFAFQNKKENMPAEEKAELQKLSAEIIDSYARLHDSFEIKFRLANLDEGIIVGAYLGEKYKNDTKLWDKLKQLRTLDDLRRLVNG